MEPTRHQDTQPIHLNQKRIKMDFTNRIKDFYFSGDWDGDGNGKKHEEAAWTPKEETEPATALEEKQALLAHHVRLVAQGRSNGLFVAGHGGLGKSKTIIETLVRCNQTPILLNSHITPLALYRTLFQNQHDEILYLDDMDGIFSNLQILGILRSALWGGKGHRLITYGSTQLPDDLPPWFPFSSGIIFSSNTIPRKNKAFEALLSRVDVFQLEATNEEVIEQMRHLATQGYGMLSPAQCHEVIDFIDSYAGTRRLSMRLYEPSLAKLEYSLTADCDWRNLVKCQLDQLTTDESVAKPLDTKAILIDALKEAIKQFPNSVKDQELFWCKTTRKSRASFFRLKKSLEQEDNE